VPLRPLGLGELLDGAVTLVRRYPRPTLGLSAALALITTLLNIPVLLTLSDSTLFDPTSSAATGSTADLEAALGELLAVGSLSFLLSFLSGVVLAGVITSVVGKGVLGEPMTLGQAWTSVRPLLLRLLGLAVVVLLIVYGVFVLAVAAAGGARRRRGRARHRAGHPARPGRRRAVGAPLRAPRPGPERDGAGAQLDPHQPAAVGGAGEGGLVAGVRHPAAGPADHHVHLRGAADAVPVLLVHRGLLR
jgi:hypothetical protein